MPTRQVTQIVTSLVVVLALVGEARFDFADRTSAPGGLLAAEASREPAASTRPIAWPTPPAFE